MATHRRIEEEPHDGSAAKRTGRDGVVAAEFADDLHVNRFSDPPEPRETEEENGEE